MKAIAREGAAARSRLCGGERCQPHRSCPGSGVVHAQWLGIGAPLHASQIRAKRSRHQPRIRLLLAEAMHASCPAYVERRRPGRVVSLLGGIAAPQSDLRRSL